MSYRKLSTLIVVFSVYMLLVAATAWSQSLNPKEQLGKAIFFDKNLSIQKNQSCATCHSLDTGFSGPNPYVNAHGSIYEGSSPGRFGDRKPPSSAYATPSPVLHFVTEKEETLFIGGNFWDGRATGEKLGNPAADQALGPFLNPVEQALPDIACIVYRVCTARYAVGFEAVWGAGACEITWPANIEASCGTPGGVVTLSVSDRAKVNTQYGNIGLSVAAYEASTEVNPFTSKFDYYLKGMVDLTNEEREGLALFLGKGKCGNCHVLDRGAEGELPLLTDFTYDNLGVPQNPENPIYKTNSLFVDEGLEAFLNTRQDYQEFAKENRGKQRVPTLRNVAGVCEGLLTQRIL